MYSHAPMPIYGQKCAYILYSIIICMYRNRACKGAGRPGQGGVGSDNSRPHVSRFCRLIVSVKKTRLPVLADKDLRLAEIKTLARNDSAQLNLIYNIALGT